MTQAALERALTQTPSLTTQRTGVGHCFGEGEMEVDFTFEEFKQFSKYKGPIRLCCANKWKWHKSHFLRLIVLYGVLMGVATFFAWQFKEAEVEHVNGLLIKRRDEITRIMSKYNITSAKTEEFLKDVKTLTKYPDRNRWEKFELSLMFVFTIMTTIGYGTFVPVTEWGMLLVVICGLITIGLCLTLMVEYFEVEKNWCQTMVRFLDNRGCFLSDACISFLHILFIGAYLAGIMAAGSVLQPFDDKWTWSESL